MLNYDLWPRVIDCEDIKIKMINVPKFVIKSCRPTRKEEVMNRYFRISAVNLLY